MTASYSWYAGSSVAPTAWVALIWMPSSPSGIASRVASVMHCEIEVIAPS